MLKTANKPAFGATYGIYFIQAGENARKPTAVIKKKMLSIEHEVADRGSKIAEYILGNNSLVLISQEAESFVKRMRYELMGEGLLGEKLETVMRRRLENEAANKFIINA